MKKILLIVGLSLFFIGCSDKLPEVNENSKKEIIPTKNGKPHGTAKYYNEEGVLYKTIQYKNGFKSGVEVISRYDLINNIIDTKTTPYIGGEKDGIEILRDNNGMVIWQKTYVNNKLNGIAKTYYLKSGKLKTRASYVNDQLHGFKTSWNEDGAVAHIEEYIYGNKIGKTKIYTEKFHEDENQPDIDKYTRIKNIGINCKKREWEDSIAIAESISQGHIEGNSYGRFGGNCKAKAKANKSNNYCDYAEAFYLSCIGVK